MVKKQAGANEPIMVPTIYIKDKQAFAKSNDLMRLLGPAVEIIKRLSQKYLLFHIIDLDLKKGSTANLDVYDKLTCFTHIQVECGVEKAIEKLAGMNARVVVSLPTSLPLERWNKKLLVGMSARASDDLSLVGDVIITSDDETEIKKIMKKCAKDGKRVMISESRWDKKTSAWAVILGAP